MIKTSKIFAFVVVAAITVAFWSCGNKTPEEAKYIVINELMPSNRTGIQGNSGNPADWIELKNTGTDSVDLKNFKLVVSSPAKNDTTGKEKSKTWSFPSVKIGGGECLVIFADKGEKIAEGDLLTADLKLPKEGATVKLLAPNDSVLSEVAYEEMEPDQALALEEGKGFKPTFWHSPGYDNTRAGYEKATEKIDAGRTDPLRIWEVMSRADHSYEHWVELKNTGSKPLDLSAYSLSKKGGKEEAWPLPKQTLAPGEIICIQMAGAKRAKGNVLFAPFKLGDAETVVLSKGDSFIDGACARPTPYGGSMGRRSGRQGFFFFAAPTRNQDNGTEGYRYIADKPEWAQKPGVHKNRVKLTLAAGVKGRKVHYTLDGSEPTMSSPIFKDSLVITQPTVVRSFAEGDSTTMRSHVATASYLVGVEHDLPIINISLKPDDMYGYNNGIYANGPGYGGDFPFVNANFWKNWTKKAYVELFDGKKNFASDCGLKIFGGFSRALEKKSLRLKFRGQYGDSKVKYDFFDTGTPLEIEDLVLRSGSQDYTRYMIKDEFFTSLAATQCPQLLTQMVRPVAVYVNAKYMGLYYLREKIDDNFVARKLNLPNDSIDVFLSGPSPYKKLEEQISGMDMTKPENLEYARKNIDFESLIDYKISNIFAGKWDTGNIRYARSRHPDSDGKWRFVFYDIDASWDPSGKPSAAFFLSTSPSVVQPENARHNVLINAMLRNPEFRQMFLQRLAFHMANTYAPANTLAHFDKFTGKIKQEMKLNCKRWTHLSYETWEKNIAEFRKRLETRSQVILKDLRQYLSVTDEENKKYFANLGY